ncbi:undecaprenyl-phosphate glucose phosphotransferase [Bacteroides xylanisolvens]|uniref:Undecaprenyl-phosphate glucose phosphotransferase n=1 Tax=Bacteroides xylanisolvens TaxID=371601 RepID=A0A6A2RPX8_9BACE|nr:undecaprenyl-phosphate glucose phosphotransferase [Bacteroides xylanisolvens]KAB6102775.1 undecaprenyl-phosphate glucose phosphotransferase [Bacteroides xylanisolvens]KAB6110259.1 undecaprenyl-phosphate glucose phosphotransferase [Bacteroides xylanisolvens]KAB6117013.1 undecaprenyl-phosphate glucose phosphotransferase [Bacteroides xylanisolvens]KAB6123890.1 undecaprenyl-phosphate glucose phosphotransferase [Bacteroides xylanisolvens]KAB6129828.1 undecaprenyl-phosphate glucose phosphotransfe
MQEVQRFNKVLKSCVLLGDLILLNLLLWGFEQFLGNRFWCENCGSILQGMALITLCYLLCNMHSGVILHRSVVRPEQIMVRVLRNMVPFVLLSVCILLLFHFEFSHSRLFGLFYIVLILVIVSYRLAFRYFLELYRKQGGNVRKVILIGSHENMQELYHAMTDDPTSGYRVLGYFEDFPSDRYPSDVSYLGHPQEVNNFLKQNVGRVDQLYCSLPSARSAEIVPIINYCENHLVRFFSVPNVRNYLKRRMHFEMLGNVPVLSIRREPLELLENRIVKRTFDIVCSTLFLCTIFPFIYIIVGVAIKMSSPGPIFFKQKRSGEDGKEFWCYKFRSMRVNAQCDTLQATEHDPRKTRIGEIIRKTSIDELPQFINVFKGDMSIVGPRPHMLKHTQEYSLLINKFMVRHFVKPGITGWAQVTGYRGETKELWQMEGRVMRDIWYIEHWTFFLDLYIMYKTVYNAIHGEKEAY